MRVHFYLIRIQGMHDLGDAFHSSYAKQAVIRDGNVICKRCRLQFEGVISKYVKIKITYLNIFQSDIVCYTVTNILCRPPNPRAQLYESKEPQNMES